MNPKGAKAWELIDKAGCRGLRRGNAQVSEKHCNFLINQGDASAADLEGLGEDVRRRVEDQTGIILEWEIKRIESMLPPDPRSLYHEQSCGGLDGRLVRRARSIAGKWRRRCECPLQMPAIRSRLLMSNGI